MKKKSYFLKGRSNIILNYYMWVLAISTCCTYLFKILIVLFSHYEPFDKTNYQIFSATSL